VYVQNPSDYGIRVFAGDCNYHDPGNVCLDFCYFVLQLWKFVLPTKMSLINQISWRDYGGPKERSGTGAMNRRGNIIEALMANAMWQSKWEKEHSARKEEPFEVWNDWLSKQTDHGRAIAGKKSARGKGPGKFNRQGRGKKGSG